MGKQKIQAGATQAATANAAKKGNASADKNVTTTATSTREDGSTVQYTLKNGKVIDAVVLNNKEHCPTCMRTLPKNKELTPEQKTRAEERQAQLAARAKEDLQRVFEMMKRNAIKSGQKVPTMEEILGSLDEVDAVAEG